MTQKFMANFMDTDNEDSAELASPPELKASNLKFS